MLITNVFMAVFSSNLLDDTMVVLDDKTDGG